MIIYENILSHLLQKSAFAQKLFLILRYDSGEREIIWSQLRVVALNGVDVKSIWQWTT